MGSPNVALLYPTPDTGEDDFLALSRHIVPSIDVEVVYLPWPGAPDTSSLSPSEIVDSLRRLGSAEHLSGAVPTALANAAHRPDVVVFAVTSSSFLHGSQGVSGQVDLLERLSGVRATSTTAAFQAAIRHLRLSTVTVASVYPPLITDHFIDRVRDLGTDVVHRVDADGRSDHEVAAWTADQITELVEQAARPDADAVLLPETALHAATITRQLECAARGSPVLTATQVTLWHAATLAGLTPRAAESGPLFAEQPVTPSFGEPGP
ncbi:MAG: hypothetical protein J2P25_16400 [Nocardiopsaceae bacterium]|nr:hypothetical protein [Nocardiopsaceae bacterium]